jgi:hypothetical protein
LFLSLTQPLPTTLPVTPRILMCRLAIVIRSSVRSGGGRE